MRTLPMKKIGLPQNPTKKIAEPPAAATCRHPDHDPPKLIVLEPGLYEHTCPACGRQRTFRVTGATW